MTAMSTDGIRELPRSPQANDTQLVLATVGGYRTALPWARLMDPEELHDFLDDLADAALNRYRPGKSDADTLSAIEAACRTWRLIAEGSDQ
ncbi:hypothetical protein [Streptomyces sp. NPDC001404]|uniref:hypothetical protein n=1 Tax=Streptomyces sp. NPDC001404 TaxID=3364571 RepID=UPI0036862776